jgi:hypothetical protein
MPKRRIRRGWEDNIEMDLNEIGCQSLHWIHLPQDTVQWLAFVNTEMDIHVT